VQSFELLSSLAAALWHPQLRKTCSERANNHSVRAPEPVQVISCRRPAVKSWSGQAAQSCEILRGPAATLGHPQLRQLATRASDRTGLRRKAPREHREKCGGRAQQPRGPLTGCLWDVPPASACRGSRTPPHSGACRLTARHGSAHSGEGTKDRGKCGGRARQSRGPLTGCLWAYPQPPLAAAVAHRPAQALAPCQAPQRK